MKLVFASDIHGSAYYARMLPEIDRREQPERIVLLGDLLLCVRGNCEAEVDQMVLEFPVMADYLALLLDGRMAFVTHGHLFNLDNPPPLCAGGLLIHGHTHVQAFTQFGEDNWYLNPGSLSIPKEDNAHSYMTYEDGRFTIKTVEGEPIRKLCL